MSECFERWFFGTAAFFGQSITLHSTFLGLIAEVVIHFAKLFSDLFFINEIIAGL